MPGRSSSSSRTPKKQSTLLPTTTGSNKKALNLKVVEKIEDENLTTTSNFSNVETIQIIDDYEQTENEQQTMDCQQQATFNNLPSTSKSNVQSSMVCKATLTIKNKQQSSPPKTPKNVKSLKIKDDTKSSKKKKNDSVKRKRTNPGEEILDVDEASHYISTKGKQSDEIIGSVASIFLTKEQRQRKKEIESLNELQKEQEKKKEINSIFCVQGAEHPLMKISKEKKREVKESKDVDLQSWQGIEPLQCNITTESLREFGFCQHVGFSHQLTINQSPLTIHIDDLLSVVDSPTTTTESIMEYSFDNHPNTQSIIHKLSQYNQNTMGRSERVKNDGCFGFPNFNNKDNNFESHFEDNCSNLIDKTIENLYPQSLWNETKKKEKGLLKKSFYRKQISLPESTRLMVLDSENTIENTSIIDTSDRQSKKDTLDDLWPIKYRPNCYEHIISKNENSDKRLLEWLEKWRKPKSLKKQPKRKETTSKKKKTKKNEDDLFTDDEYDDEDDELEKCILLYGPTSGKSSSLHAIATQLGFEIMEVNSACDRSSKSIMELRETTQSKVIGNSVGKIIVFEDADLKFKEESYGSFITSIEKLEKSTKRPIILISDNVNENDLLNSVCRQKIDYCCRDPFTICTTEKVNQQCKYILDVCIYIYSIMLCEGIKLNVERDLFPLVVFFEGDLKKILLHLQFWFYRANSTPLAMDITTTDERIQTKSLLEQILGLDKCCYEKSVDKFRQAEDDAEVMQELDIPFYNYLNNANSINSNFISTLSQADMLRRVGNELSCKIYSTIEILAISTLPEKNFKSDIDLLKPVDFLNRSSIPITSDGTISRNLLLKSKLQQSQSFFYTLIKHIMTRQEYVCVHPSNYLYRRNMTDIIHHLFSMCNSENQRRENASRRRFFHYLKNLVHDEDELEMLEALAKQFEYF